MFNGFFAARKNPRVEGHTLYWIYAWNERETEYNFETRTSFKEARQIAKEMVAEGSTHHVYVLYGNKSGAFTHLDAAAKVYAATARKNPSSSSLRGVKAIGWFSDDDRRKVTDAGDFLVDALASGAKSPALMLYKDVDGESTYVGGVDFAAGTDGSPSDLRSTRMWYWPAAPESRLIDRNVAADRYNNPRDALLVSIRKHPEAATVFGATRQRVMYMNEPGSVFFVASIRVTSFFDNDRYLAEGTAQAWWKAWVEKAKVGSATKWKGSDDPML